MGKEEGLDLCVIQEYCRWGNQVGREGGLLGEDHVVVRKEWISNFQ